MSSEDWVNPYDDDEDDDDGSAGREPVDLGLALPIKETRKALLVLRADLSDLWLPKSVIHDNSEVFSMKSGRGKLIVKAWWATRENLSKVED